MMSLILLNYSFANVVSIECHDSLKRYIINDFSLINSDDQISTYENGGLANLKLIDTLTRRVSMLFCGIYEDEDLTFSNRFEVKDRIKIACSASHFDPARNIRLRINKSFNESPLLLAVLELSSVDKHSPIDQFIPLSCNVKKEDIVDPSDSCYEQCGRSCFEGPVFCGQW